MTTIDQAARTTSVLQDHDPVTLVAGYVPVIDLSSSFSHEREARHRVARTIGRVCETSGFFAVVGHGVSAATIADVYRAMQELFSLPANAKAALASAPGDPLMRGFGRTGSLAASNADASVPAERALPDLSETWTYNRLGEPGALGLPRDADPLVSGPNHWPDLPDFRTAVRNYYREMERLAAHIMSLFAVALDLPEDWFADKINQHMTNLTANYYPPQPLPPAPGQLRKGQHSDWGSLTVLYQDDAPGGLQVLDKQGKWLDVPAIEESFVVNIGDLMAVWTNDRWVSTTHRVVNPPRDLAQRERYSLPFFHQPNFEAVIDTIPTCTGPTNPPRHAATQSGAYILEKFRRAYGD